MNNASENLKEILCEIADGEEVQYLFDGKWVTPKEKTFPLTKTGLKLHWRKKPNAFEEAYNKFYEDYYFTKHDGFIFKAGWQAAIKHMENSND